MRCGEIYSEGKKINNYSKHFHIIFIYYDIPLIRLMQKCHSIDLGRKFDKANVLLSRLIVDNKIGLNEIKIGINNLTTIMLEQNTRMDKHNTRLEAILEKLAER